MNILVLLRHGESTWNKENRFTGWTDVELTDKGRAEAAEAGRLLKENGFTFDIAFTSFLIRAEETLAIVKKEMACLSLPIFRSWRLNERHYGALQGLNKAETAKKYGEDKVLIWRRSYDVPPPALEKSDERYPGNDPTYKDVSSENLPLTESLKDTIHRFMPYWHGNIVPEIKSGKKVLIVAHGNSLRALVKHLDDIPDEKIVQLNIPTGIPLVYELNDELNPIRNYYIGDQELVNQAVKSVANQGKAK